MKIHFYKILTYQSRPDGGDVFRYLTQLGLQEIDPPTLAPEKLLLEAQCVFHSSLRRARDCICHQTNVKYIETPNLSEILFDLPKLCTREEWVNEGSIAVRRGLLTAFTSDNLPTPRNTLFRQSLTILEQAAQPDQTVALVAHSFRLKILEALIQTQGKLIQEPTLLDQYLYPEKRTYEFGQGFSCDREQLRSLTQTTKKLLAD